LLVSDGFLLGRSERTAARLRTCGEPHEMNSPIGSGRLSAEPGKSGTRRDASTDNVSRDEGHGIAEPPLRSVASTTV